MRKIIFICFVLLATFSFAEELPVKEIKNEEVWSGEVIVKGVVAVRREGKLKIMPGTKILFEAKDYDDDGIGDGELYIEGEIECVGTKENPILFSVSSDKVIPSQWKYVMVNHGKKALFEWTIFEGAFSGLQIHFTNAVVKNSHFRKNIDGFRFSTANVFVVGCKMYNNKHGIRYEERDSRGKICGNEIINNEIGIFPVTKCKGKVEFRLNNIYENEYNIKVGDEQKDDISFANNYFGEISKTKIKKTIYDRRYDKNLPVVNFEPFLRKKTILGDKACLKE